MDLGLSLTYCQACVLQFKFVLEQFRNISLELLRTIVEHPSKNVPFNVLNMSLNFSRLFLKWFKNNSRNVVMVCSRTVLELTLVCSRTDVEQTFIIFLEQL